MKILFAIPKLKAISGGKGLTVSPHAGVAYLSSFLKKNGIEVKVYDEGIENNRAELLLTIRDFKPDVVGITIFSYCYNYACDLIKTIKNNCKSPLVLGGAHINIVKGQILLETGAEFAIKHEGEHGLLELLKEIESGGNDFVNIKGLIWKDNNGKVTENPDRTFITELDSLPFPDYDVFDIKKYFCFKDKILPIITSRGCPFGCNFCSVRLCMGQGFRARSAQNVVQEIELLTQKGWRNFNINDDCFTLNKQRAEEICDLIIKKNLNIGFQFLNGIRVDTVNPQLLKKMKSAGCFYISYGCESGNERILKTIKKGIILEQVRKAVEWTNDANIPNSVNFIIGHTEETYQTAMDTISFAESLPTYFANFYNLIPYPGTEAYSWAQQHGRFLVPSEYYLENIGTYHGRPIFETSEFTKIQREKIVGLGFNLYRLKYLQYRFGKVAGYFIFCVTKLKPINIFAAFLVLDTRLGKSIYTLLCNLIRNPNRKS